MRPMAAAGQHRGPFRAGGRDRRGPRSGRAAALPGAIRRWSHCPGVPRPGRDHRASAQEGQEGAGQRLARAPRHSCNATPDDVRTSYGAEDGLSGQRPQSRSTVRMRCTSGDMARTSRGTLAGIAAPPLPGSSLTGSQSQRDRLRPEPGAALAVHGQRDRAGVAEPQGDCPPFRPGLRGTRVDDALEDRRAARCGDVGPAGFAPPLREITTSRGPRRAAGGDGVLVAAGCLRAALCAVTGLRAAAVPLVAGPDATT